MTNLRMTVNLASPVLTFLWVDTPCPCVRVLGRVGLKVSHKERYLLMRLGKSGGPSKRSEQRSLEKKDDVRSKRLGRVNWNAVVDRGIPHQESWTLWSSKT